MDYRNEREILLDMIEYANTNGPIRTSEDIITNIKEGNQTENQYVLDLSTHSVPLAQMEANNYENYQNININTATGEALDNFGNLLNVARSSAQPLMVDIDLDAGVVLSEAITIPEGTSVLLQQVYDDVPYDFVTDEEVTIAVGSQVATVRARSTLLGYRGSLPIGAVVGLQGFANVSATNSEETTPGKNIEEDEDYRIRLKGWASQTTRGSTEIIDNYLSHYTGLNSYKLIPRYDGVGTLKIVCDTLESELDNIAMGVDENCMILTDYPTVCVLPEVQTISTLSLTCTKGNLGNLTEAELSQIIAAQVMTYVMGGQDRNGVDTKGIGIGEDFYPSQLLKYLQGQIPEVVNFDMDMTPVSVAETSKLVVDTVEVLYDD